MNDHLVYACRILRNEELTPRGLFMVITFKVLFRKKKKNTCKVRITITSPNLCSIGLGVKYFFENILCIFLYFVQSKNDGQQKLLLV